MMKYLALLSALFSFFFIGNVIAGDTPSKPDTMVYFINLNDGDEVSSPVTIKFGLKGMGVAPAGTEKKHTGHHHLFIDRPPFGEGEDGMEEKNANIPADKNHKHFGGGQTETVVELAPGKHTLQLVLADKTIFPITRRWSPNGSPSLSNETQEIIVGMSAISVQGNSCYE